MKQCKKCGSLKDESEFRPHKRTNDGLSHICCKCKDEVYLPWNSRSQQAGSNWIYLVAAINGLVKIGSTSDLDKRVSLLRSQSPLPVELIFTVQCLDAGSIERQLHFEFRQYHDHGEWYKLSASDIERIKSYAYSLISHNARA